MEIHLIDTTIAATPSCGSLGAYHVGLYFEQPTMETTLEGINGKVPTELWAAIFKITQETEYDNFMKCDDEEPLRPIVYVLSSVCRHWHSIVYEEYSLWSLVPVPLTAPRRQGNYGLLNTAVTKSKAPITLVINMSQSLKDPRSFPTTPETTIFGQKSYCVHMKARKDNIRYVDLMVSGELSKADAIIISAVERVDYLSFRSASKSDYLESFTFINDYPLTMPWINSKHQLKSMTCRLKQFPPRTNINTCLYASLEELYILQEISKNSLELTTGIDFKVPNLHTLGITPAAAVLLHRVEMPKIQKLMLHGSIDGNEHVQVSTSANAGQIYQKLAHIEFRDWKVVDGSNSNSGSISLLWGMGPKLKALKSIKFIDSFIDGAALVKVFNDLIRDGGNGSLGSLKEITLSNVKGITRDECDAVRDLVPNLNIYV